MRELKEKIVTRIRSNQNEGANTSVYCLEDLREESPMIYHEAIKLLLGSGEVTKNFGSTFLHYKVPE